MKKNLLLLTLVLLYCSYSVANDTLKYKFMFSLPLVDIPQNIDLPYNYPSMNQSAEFALGTYELGYWGIDGLGNLLFKKDKSLFLDFTNFTFKYLAGLVFSKFGSELPIPLGVWSHEEFHRSVLGTEDLSTKNGNWIFTRWDGTVFGVSDYALDNLKQSSLDQLLYSYVAGVHSELYLNQIITVRDFYKSRSLYKNSLLLYNAWYVYDYFKFSTSSFSDSVKIEAPEHENSNPSERDFAGADLTSWAYDMFNPDLPFTSRDNFPGGEGVNRRVGFSDLSVEAQDYLNKQKSLSLINFLNPAIFFINRIKLTENFNFNLFAQYVPTHFGNSISVFLPVEFRRTNLVISAHNYNNYEESGYGAGVSIQDIKLSEKFGLSSGVKLWNQPESFFSSEKIAGGKINLMANYALSKNIKGYVDITGKSKGWELGNPYLRSNISFMMGLSYSLPAI